MRVIEQEAAEITDDDFYAAFIELTKFDLYGKSNGWSWNQINYSNVNGEKQNKVVIKFSNDAYCMYDYI